MTLLPKVLKSDNVFEEFQPQKIIDSIHEKTNLSIDICGQLATSVIRIIIAGNMQFITGPSIREMVCSELIRSGYEKERSKLSRIGMSLLDFEELINNGHTLSEIKDQVYNQMLFEYHGLTDIYNKL